MKFKNLITFSFVAALMVIPVPAVFAKGNSIQEITEQDFNLKTGFRFINSTNMDVIGNSSPDIIELHGQPCYGRTALCSGAFNHLIFKVKDGQTEKYTYYKMSGDHIFGGRDRGRGRGRGRGRSNINIELKKFIEQTHQSK